MDLRMHWVGIRTNLINHMLVISNISQYEFDITMATTIDFEFIYDPTNPFVTLWTKIREFYQISFLTVEICVVESNI